MDNHAALRCVQATRQTMLAATSNSESLDGNLHFERPDIQTMPTEPVHHERHDNTPTALTATTKATHLHSPLPVNSTRRCQFVTSIPSPYQLDFFRALQELVPNSFQVVFCAAREVDRAYYSVPDAFGFDAVILGDGMRRFGKDLHSNPGLSAALAGYNAVTTVVGGTYFMPDALAAREYCLRHKRNFIYWGEHPFKKSDAWLKRQLKGRYLSWFLKPAAGLIGIGQAASAAYARFARDRPVENIPYSPNLDRLITPPAQLKAAARDFRGKVGGDPIILYAGSLIERKAPDTLLAAFLRCSDNLPRAALVFAGEGPMRARLEMQARQSRRSAQIHFCGYLAGDDMKAAYLAADIFVLPTRGHEGWGVVLQEAMAASCAVIASTRVGAAFDLLNDGKHGLICQPDSVAELSTLLSRLGPAPALRCSMGQEAARGVAGTGASAAANRFCRFLQTLPVAA